MDYIKPITCLITWKTKFRTCDSLFSGYSQSRTSQSHFSSSAFGGGVHLILVTVGHVISGLNSIRYFYPYIEICKDSRSEENWTIIHGRKLD